MPRNIENFYDSLGSIKGQLFAAPADVKASFNTLVQYFAQDEPSADLYLKNEDTRTLSINLSAIKEPLKKFGMVQFSYDPHGGFYFHGKMPYLQQLQKAIKEPTDLVEC